MARDTSNCTIAWCQNAGGSGGPCDGCKAHRWCVACGEDAEEFAGTGSRWRRATGDRCSTCSSAGRTDRPFESKPPNDTNCVPTADHCYHPTGGILTCDPPLVVEVCCYCDGRRNRRTPLGSGGGHGEHKPQHGGYVCPCGFGSEDAEELVRHLASHDLASGS